MTKKFNTFVESVLKEYFVVGDKTRKDIRTVLQNIKHEMHELSSGTMISIDRKDAPTVLRDLKREGYLLMYEYPVEEPAILLVFPGPKDAVKLFKNNPSMHGRFVKY